MCVHISPLPCVSYYCVYLQPFVTIPCILHVYLCIYCHARVVFWLSVCLCHVCMFRALNAVLFQGLYCLQAFAESISLNVCTLIVFFLWANLIWNSTSILCQNTPQRKSGLLGSVYWTKFLSVFQNVTEGLDWGLVRFIPSVCAFDRGSFQINGPI